MKITFLGTRGYIEARTRRHYRHTSTMISNRGKNIMIDCGIDWEKKVWKINPDAIVITHAHPDHADGLKKGSPCPVYATKESWEIMNKFEIKQEQRHVMVSRKPKKIFGVKFETFMVEHSILASGVGYRISAGKVTIFCVHDLVFIHERKEALKGCKLYIGDGATIKRPMVRRKGKRLFGHTSIQTQLTWCQKEGVPWAIITHCGSQIVERDERKILPKIKKIAQERGIKVEIAYDGMEVNLRS